MIKKRKLSAHVSNQDIFLKEKVIFFFLNDELTHYLAIYERGDDTEWFYILKNGKLQIETKISIEKGNVWPIVRDLDEII